MLDACNPVRSETRLLGYLQLACLKNGSTGGGEKQGMDDPNSLVFSDTGN